MFYVYSKIPVCSLVLRAFHDCGVNNLLAVQEAFEVVEKRQSRTDCCPQLGTVRVLCSDAKEVVFLANSKTEYDEFSLSKQGDKMQLTSFILWDGFEDFHPSDRCQFPGMERDGYAYLLDQYHLEVSLGNKFAEFQYSESPWCSSNFGPMSRALAIDSELRHRLFSAISQADPDAKVLFRWNIGGRDQGYSFARGEENEPFLVDFDNIEIDQFAEDFNRWTSLSVLKSQPPDFLKKRRFLIWRINGNTIRVAYGGSQTELKNGAKSEMALTRCLERLFADSKLYSCLKAELSEFLEQEQRY